MGSYSPGIDAPVPYKLTIARKRSGYTQEQVAKLLERNVSTIAKWERGDHVPQLQWLVALSTLYKIPLGFFYDPSVNGGEAYE